MKNSFQRKPKAAQQVMKAGIDALGLFRKSRTSTGKGNGVRRRGR